jgi:hypothetical protein
MMHSIAKHVAKTNMFNAIHTTTELLRKTCNLQYDRIYTEPRKGHYRCKVYNSNITELSTKKVKRIETIINSVMSRSGYKTEISVSDGYGYYVRGPVNNLIIRVYAK